MRTLSYVAAVSTALVPVAHAQEVLFVGTSFVAAPDPWFVIDVEAETVIATGTSPRTEGCFGAVFQPGALVVGSLSGEEVSAAPLVSSIPDFDSPVFQEDLGDRPYRLRFDDAFERFVTVSNGGLTSDLFLLQGDPDAPDYGSKIAQVGIDSVEGWSVSEGATLFASVPLFFSGFLTTVDIDPASTTFLTPTVSPPTAPLGTAYGIGTMISSDDRFVTVVAPTPTETFILKYDRQNGEWVDIEPSLLGEQYFRVSSSFAMYMEQIPGTDTAIVVGTDFAQGFVARLDVSGPPSTWSFDRTDTFSGLPVTIALSPDASRFALTTSSPARVLTGSVSDGTLGAEIVIPGDPPNPVTLAWGEGELGLAYCTPAEANSTGAPARIAAAGSAVALSNQVELTVSSLPPSSFGFLIAGKVQGFTANPAGSAGNLCLSGAIGRYVGPGEIRQADSAGLWRLAIDLTATPQPNGVVPVLAGETWNYQAWYRDSLNGTATSNFSPGLSIEYR